MKERRGGVIVVTVIGCGCTHYWMLQDDRSWSSVPDRLGRRRLSDLPLRARR